MKRKLKHTTTDKARRMGELISLKQPAPVEQPSGKDIAEMLKGLSFTIGRKGQKHERRSNDTTADDKQLGTDD